MKNTTSDSDKHYGYQLADPLFYVALKQYAQRMRAQPTHAEMLLWNALRGKKLDGHKFRRQHIIGRYITDLVCLKKRLIIEIDGLIHQLPDNQQSDAERQEELEGMGFTVTRFTNKEVETQLEDVLEKIGSILNKLQEISTQ
ncbi:endonuclease domain-containing protein [Flaviaesturariibacter aridisoli]|uniref:Endonuclease domain-containing protein n=1 Tax=Flaviaesturariibacter aridisoli TaxID=2545761 RepID=A0A4R4E4E9_9BACT|nr:endonuclease domain-containing protein [Flaviaesturariibacter aridisoli]TCZ73723.1 endonuclease domain-containing protein [Flaviaesturariibacter aridisoli]